jgi:serine protease Do
MTLLDDIASTTTRIAASAGPSIVAIGRDGRGSGVVLAPGTVLTNAHNLRDRSTAVTFADGRQVQADALGVDVDRDLAVLAVDTADAPALDWAAGPAVAPGTPLLALASSRGGSTRVTFGTVSAIGQAFRGPRGRLVSDAFEHTAPLARGSSGGPVVDLEGRLLGINTKRVGEGFYLAVLADAGLRSRVDALTRGERPVGAQLGVGLAPAHVASRLRASVGLPAREGLLVQVVAEDGPADRAGISTGDLLVAADGREISTADALLDVLDAVRPGGRVTLQVVRGAEEREVAVDFPADGAAGAGDQPAE